MPQPALPADDLYARLSVPTNASPEAIEVAWRALLRRHHPDVAGPDGLEQAKRINVAHDWLSDPALRARYDREHGLRHGIGPRGDGHRAWHARDGAGRRRAPPGPDRPPARGPGHAHRPVPRPRRGADPDRDRPPGAGRTAADRLRRHDPAVPPARAAGRARRGRGRGRRPPPAGRAPPDDPRRHRRLRHRARPGPVPRRAPDRAVPRARPRAAHARLGRRRRPAAVRTERRRGRGARRAHRRLDAAGLRRLADTGSDVRGTEDPWPPDVSPDDDDALRDLGDPRRARRRGRGPGRPRGGGPGEGAAGGRAAGPSAGAAPRLRAGGVRRADRVRGGPGSCRRGSGPRVRRPAGGR